MLSIQEIPQLPKIAREVLLAVNLSLKHLQEALASGAGPPHRSSVFYFGAWSSYKICVYYYYY
jgi:hypothetical protein